MALSDQTTQALAKLQQDMTRYCLIAQKIETNDETLRQVKHMKRLLKTMEQHELLASKDSSTPFQRTGEDQTKSLKGSSSSQSITGTHIDVEPEKVQDANNFISIFAGEETESPFVNLSKAYFIQMLRERISKPQELHQRALNLCGASSFAVNWVERDPKGFARTVIDLYEKGKAEYNGIELKVDEAMYEGHYNAMHPVDWLVLSALQNSSGHLGYNPGDSGAVEAARGIALPGKVLEWFQSLAGSEVTRYQHDLSPIQMSRHHSSGETVILLVNYEIFRQARDSSRDPDDVKNNPIVAVGSMTGTHYVVLNSTITFVGNEQITFNFWHWGRNDSITMSSAQFENAVVEVFVLPPEEVQ